MIRSGLQHLRFLLGQVHFPRDRVLRLLASRSDLLTHRFLFPMPWSSPHQRRILFLERPGALGDVLMCTPALRRLKQVNPRCRVVLFTRFRDVVEGLPFIDEVCDDYDRLPPEAIGLKYEHCLPTDRHLARVFGDALGLRVPDVRPSCIVPAETVARFRLEWSKLRRPWVVINRKAGPWTPNKDWPDSHWRELVESLSRRCTLIEIGAKGETNVENVAVDLRGRTTRLEMAAALAAADVHVGPVSGPTHIAAAVGTPAVVIYGGYENLSCSKYRGNINLYSPVPCHPCWLRTPCPYDRKCLRQISVHQVESAIWKLWNKQM